MAPRTTAAISTWERTCRFELLGLLLLCCASTAWGGRAYVSNEDGNSVTVIDTQRLEAIATIDVGKRPRGMKVDRQEVVATVARYPAITISEIPAQK